MLSIAGLGKGVRHWIWSIVPRRGNFGNVPIPCNGAQAIREMRYWRVLSDTQGSQTASILSSSWCHDRRFLMISWRLGRVISASFPIRSLDSYAFNVRAYLSECRDLFDNNKFFSCNENFKYLWIGFYGRRLSWRKRNWESEPRSWSPFWMASGMPNQQILTRVDQNKECHSTENVILVLAL